MNTLKKILFITVIDFALIFGLYACTPKYHQPEYLTGTITGESGSLVQDIQTINEKFGKCEENGNKTIDQLLICKALDSEKELSDSEYMLQVMGDDGNIYNLSIQNRVENHRLFIDSLDGGIYRESSCVNTKLSDLIRVESAAEPGRRIRFPKDDRFDTSFTGQYGWCELAFHW